VLIFVHKREFLFGTATAVFGQAMSHGQGEKGISEIFKNLGFFAKSLVFPYPHYSFIKELGNSPLFYSFAAVTGAALLAGIVMRKRLVVFSLFWLILTAIPYLFVPMLSSNVAITAERYIYMPSAGFAILMAVAAYGLFKSRNWAKKAGYLFILALVLYSFAGVGYFFKVWRSEETFWRNALKLNPDYVSGYVSIASIELGRGNEDGAKRLLMEGLGKKKGLPAEFAQAAQILGQMALKKGELARAESYFQQSLRYSPYEFAYIDLGFLYLRVGNLESAKSAFESALEFPQKNVRAMFGLATAYSMLGDKEKARQLAMQVYDRARDEQLKALAIQIIRDR
jgi:tetratricopeptide (TPR) repeat protein